MNCVCRDNNYMQITCLKCGMFVYKIGDKKIDMFEQYQIGIDMMTLLKTINKINTINYTIGERYEYIKMIENLKIFKDHFNKYIKLIEGGNT